MELLLIRHALPQRREVEDGPADPELSDVGHVQADHLARYLADEHLDAIYASPLRRARQTAAPVARDRGIEVVIEDDVAEYDRDSSSYVPVEELRASDDPRWQQMLAGEWDDPEQRDGFDARVLESIERIVSAHRGQRVAIACHGGVINTYLSHVIGLGDGRRSFFYPNYTSIHRVAASSAGARSVITLNETSHLRGTGLPMGMFQQG